MQEIISFFVFITGMTICYQFYRHAITLKGKERQVMCQRLGIAFTSIGTTALVLRSVFFVFSGLVLIMFGLRLIAHGMDRINKKIYIDRYTGDD